MEEFLTACPRNCYSTCSFRVQVETDIGFGAAYHDNRIEIEGVD
jgi:hypothetical protein